MFDEHCLLRVGRMHSDFGKLIDFSGAKMYLIMDICDYFLFQADDGIRGAQESRGLGDVYKRQGWR